MEKWKGCFEGSNAVTKSGLQYSNFEQNDKRITTYVLEKLQKTRKQEKQLDWICWRQSVWGRKSLRVVCASGGNCFGVSTGLRQVYEMLPWLFKGYMEGVVDRCVVGHRNMQTGYCNRIKDLIS